MGGLAVVIGSGRSVWDDLRAVASPYTAFAVNDMVVFAPHVHHAVSHHPNKLAHWLALRTKTPLGQQREAAIVTHSATKHEGIDRIWPEFRAGGSSSLLAVRIALALGHERVAVVGVPLDASGYVWSDPRQSGHQDFLRYRKTWIELRPQLLGRVTAVSGWLRDLLSAERMAAVA